MRRTLIWRVLCLYGLLLLGCVGMISWNARAGREVSVIESREEAQRRADVSLPVRIEFQDAYLGQGAIDEEEGLQRVDELRRKFLSRGAADGIPDVGNEIRMTGHIVYLNGRTQEFALGSRFWLGGIPYGSGNGDVQNIMRTILAGLVTPQHLSVILPHAAEVRWLSGGGTRVLAPDECRRLAAALLQAEPLVKCDKQLQFEVRQMRPSAHLRILLHAPERPGVHLTDDVLNLDIYENGCLALQYLGDTSGRSLWSASEVCQDWSGGRSS